MHRSAFSYSLTRPYPYPWFTWLVVIGGIVVTALFSVFSVVANGYDIALVTVANPNETESPSSPAWFQQRPWSFASKDQVFPLYSTVFTTALSSRHVIQAIYKRDDTKWLRQRSLSYHYSNLHNCVVSRFTLAAWSGGYNASALSACTVYDNHNATRIELWTYLDDTPANEVTFDLSQWPSWFSWQVFLGNAQLRSCLKQMTELTNSTSWSIRSDYFFTSPVSSITDRKVLSSSSVKYDNTTVNSRIGDSWLLDYDPRAWTQISLTGHSNISLDSWASAYGLDTLSLFDTFVENQSPYLQPWNYSTPSVSLALRIDNIAKLMYSGLLSDFGQSSSSNIFTTPENIWDYANAVDVMNHELGDDTFPQTLAYAVSENSAYPPYNFNETTKQNISTLFAWGNTTIPTVSEAFLNTLYLCQIPKMKSVLSLIFAVLVADLVFLQAMWIMLNFVVKTVLEHQDDTANYCSGCANSIPNNGTINEIGIPSPIAGIDTPFPTKSTMISSITEDIEKPPDLRRRAALASAQISEQSSEESAMLLSHVRKESEQL